MPFDPAAYGPQVEQLLALDGSGARLLPLVIERPSSAEAVERLTKLDARTLFPDSRAPEAALSGLWLYFSCFEQSHSLSQDIPTTDGSYWHGIAHRQEPDPGNAGYWFRRVGNHAIFPELNQRAAELGYRTGAEWNPFDFIDYCEKARRSPGSAEERIARAVTTAEWQILFHHCAKAA